jgi:RecA-family ATPase
MKTVAVKPPSPDLGAEFRGPPSPKPIDWNALAAKGEPPARIWWMQDWLTPAPTGFFGAGGKGKSLVAQAICTALAAGKSYITPEADPRICLTWSCEDDQDEIWRRQSSINRFFGVEMADIAGKHHMVARLGCDNSLFAPAFGSAVFTGLLKELREQVNDLKVDVLVLDNIAQVFGGLNGDAHHATVFVNGIAGLVTGRPFAPIFLGHVARAEGSEFAGSAAWENACRMRWFIGASLPGEKPDSDDEADPDTVFLARRKANYTGKDYTRLRYQNGLLVPEGALMGRLDEQGRKDIAERIVIKGFNKLAAAGINAVDGKNSPDFLPSQIVAKGYAEGHSKKELAAALNRLIGSGTFARGIVGKYANRSDRLGLVLVNS